MPGTMTASKSLAIITGASRGIGRAIAIAFPDVMLSVPLHMILISRSAESLQETARLVKQKCDGDNGGITISCFEMDLSDLDTLPEKFEQILDTVSSAQYDSCWLINNAGSLGHLGLASAISGDSDMKELRKSVDFNLTSSIWVSSQFTKAFLPLSSSVRIANISSLCAIEPFPTMAQYCAGKAGRDMFHSVLAKEHKTTPNESEEESTTEKEGHRKDTKQHFKTLNYAPGACATQMTDDLAECPVLDDGLHNYFTSSKEEKTLIRPEDTAKKLVRLLRLDQYESGSHVDYWDVSHDDQEVP